MTDYEKSVVANLLADFQNYFYETAPSGVNFCDAFCPLADTCEGGFLPDECAEKYVNYIDDD